MILSIDYFKIKIKLKQLKNENYKTKKDLNLYI